MKRLKLKSLSPMVSLNFLRRAAMKIAQPFKFKIRGHRLKRRLTGCCLLIIVSVLLTCGLIGYLIGRAMAQTPAEMAYEVLLLIDQSNSMVEKSDPNLLRLEAARLFMTYLGVDSGGVIHRLGVIFFGGEAKLVVPLTPLTDDARRVGLVELLDNPPRMSWTNPGAALELAETTLALTTAPNPQQAVVLLTDGKPEWTTTPTAKEREAIIVQLREQGQRFAAAKIPLFIILLQNSATDADPEIEQIYVPLWQEMAAMTPPGRFYQARQSEELLDIYHDIVITLTGRQTAGVVMQTQVQTETVEPVSVEPGLAQVTFVIRKSDPALQVEIIRPGGQLINSNEAGVQHGGQPGQSLEEIWAINDPQAGIWQVRMNGQGAVTVWKDFDPATVTPTFTPNPTATFTPSPTVTPIPLPTATLAPTLTPVPSPTHSPSPTLTLIPQPTATATAAPIRTASSPSSLLWWLFLPLAVLMVGSGGWLWLRRRRARPFLTGILRQVVAPGLNGATSSIRLDLDSLGRRRIRLGPTSSADLYLPSTPNQPTPSVRLIAHLEADDQPGVSLAPEPAQANSAPVQVNNMPVSHAWSLCDGDVITLGVYRFKYENLRQRKSRDAKREVRSRDAKRGVGNRGLEFHSLLPTTYCLLPLY